MKKRSFKKLITLSLTLAMLTGVAGCGKQQSLNAETNPDTPVSDVQFPLKEKAELSFITSAPATSTQDPNERTIFLENGEADQRAYRLDMLRFRPVL